MKDQIRKDFERVVRKMFFVAYREYKKYNVGGNLVSLIFHYFTLHGDALQLKISFRVEK